MEVIERVPHLSKSNNLTPQVSKSQNYCASSEDMELPDSLWFEENGTIEDSDQG